MSTTAAFRNNTRLYANVLGDEKAAAPVVSWQAGADAVTFVRIGDSASTTANDQVALLGDASATRAVAIGENSVAAAEDTVVIGDSQTNATALRTVVIGAANGTTLGNVVENPDSVLIGYGVKPAAGAHASVVGIGDNAQVSGNYAVAVGRSSNALGASAVAVGNTALASASSVAIGETAESNGSLGVTIGPGAIIDGTSTESVAIGRNATVPATSGWSTVIGAGSTADLAAGTMIGAYGSVGRNGVSAGYGAISTGTLNAVAIGFESTAHADSAVSVGARSDAYNIDTTAVGYQAAADTQGSIALGARSSASTGTENIAIGYQTTTLGDYSIAIGSTASAPNERAVSIGLDVASRMPDSFNTRFARVHPVTATTTTSNSATLNLLRLANAPQGALGWVYVVCYNVTDVVQGAAYTTAPVAAIRTAASTTPLVSTVTFASSAGLPLPPGHSVSIGAVVDNVQITFAQDATVYAGSTSWRAVAFWTCCTEAGS